LLYPFDSSSGLPDRHRRGREALTALTEDLGEQLARRRAQPADDLLAGKGPYSADGVECTLRLLGWRRARSGKVEQFLGVMLGKRPPRREIR
jgi:hypothetical protein